MSCRRHETGDDDDRPAIVPGLMCGQSHSDLDPVCGRTRQEDCPCKTDEQRIVEGPRVRFEERKEASDGSATHC